MADDAEPIRSTRGERCCGRVASDHRVVSGLTSSMLEVVKHCGVTVWPWTYDSQTDFFKFYTWGTHGLTTNDVRFASNFVAPTRRASPERLPQSVFGLSAWARGRTVRNDESR